MMNFAAAIVVLGLLGVVWAWLSNGGGSLGSRALLLMLFESSLSWSSLELVS